VQLKTLAIQEDIMASQKNPAVALLRAQLKSAHETLEGTMVDVTHDQAHWKPAGKAHPIGASYAHIATGEDYLVNGILKGSALMCASSWAGKAGLSEPPPQGQAWEEWARRVKVDLPALKAYSQAVYQATDSYLASLSDADLERSCDMSGFGMGQQPASTVFSMATEHAAWHTGEISSVKGLQGLQGYPF
jgi:hypothetical protein